MIGSSRNISAWMLMVGIIFVIGRANAASIALQGDDPGTLTNSQIKPDSSAKPQFTQVNSAAVSSINSSAWNGSLSPVGSDFDFTSGNLSPRALQTLLTYTQSGEAISDWTSSNPADDLLIDSGPAGGEQSAGVALKKSPEGVSSEVSLPPASRQSLPLLLLIAFLPPVRKKLAKAWARA